MKHSFMILLAFIIVLPLYSTTYDEAIMLISDGNLKEARALLTEYIENNGTGENQEYYFLLLKTYSFKTDFEEKIVIAEIISQSFPFLRETQLMRIEIANYFITEQEYFEASKWLMEIIMFTSAENENHQRAAERLIKYINMRLEPAQIEYLMYNYNVQELIPLMIFRLYALHYENNEFEQAEFFRQKLIIEFPDSYYTKKFLLELENNPDARKKIAILLPTTGEFAPFGESVRRGIVIANDEENIDFVIFNTFSSPVLTVELLDSIYNDKSFIAVIGPVSSMETIAAGAYLYDEKYLPILAPVATDGDLSRFDNDIFLINKTLVEQAKFTADYLSQMDSIQTVGIIFPDDSYGKTLASSFSNALKGTYTTIMFEISYIPGTSDFTDKINVIKEMNVDAIYLPVSAEDAILLSTQLMYYDVNTQLIGSDSWYNENLLRLAKDYIQGAIIVKPMKMNEYSEKFINFKLKFMKKYNIAPDRFSMLSYDTFKMLALIIKNGYNNRADIIKYLKNMKYYSGISGKISFSQDRDDFDIMEVINSEFVKKELINE